MKKIFSPFTFPKSRFFFNVLLMICFFFQNRCFAQPGLAWAKSMGGIGDDRGISTAVDASGNVYTTGYFNGTVDFDPGSGVYNLRTTGGFGDDIFISKFDADGNFVWVKQLGVYYNPDAGYAITVDARQNVYVAGLLSNPPRSTNSANVEDILICKLDAKGNFLWQKRIGGRGGEFAKSIATDRSGNVYVCGNYSSTTDFDPGEGTYNLTSAGYYDVFISKYDSSGNFVWAKSIGGNYSDVGSSLAVDGTGHLYVMGTFYYTLDVDPGPGTFNLTSPGNNSSTFYRQIRYYWKLCRCRHATSYSR